MTSEDVNFFHDDQCFRSKALSRRAFGCGSVASAQMLVSRPALTQGLAVVERDVQIATPDGICDAAFFHPPEGSYPAVIKWTDIIGLRPVFRDMARRLASHGYSVLLPNPFYRDGPAPLHKPDFDFSRPEERNYAMDLLSHLFAPGAADSDIAAFTSWLSQQRYSVDQNRCMGTTGYCMGVWLAIRASALLPDQIRALAGFHPGRLITPRPDSPHLLIPKIKAKVHIGIAEDDDAEAPEEKYELIKLFKDADVLATVKVYEDANHSWCVPTSAAYNEAQAEEAWSTLVEVFKSGLTKI